MMRDKRHSTPGAGPRSHARAVEPHARAVEPPGRAVEPAARCACSVPDTHEHDSDARRAVGVDADIKTRNLTRLRRIEGQVRGLQKMVEDERYCADILVQISSVQEALRAVGRELMRNHLKHCAAAAIRSGPEAAEAAYDELISLIYTHNR